MNLRNAIVARNLLQLEPVALTVITVAFAYGSNMRRGWLWLLLLWPLFLGLRWLAHGRLLTRVPLLWPCVALILLAALNVYAAPYTRGLEMLARPLLGLWICWALIETARDSGSMNRPLWTAALLGLLAGVLALGATEWSESKSGQMWTVIEALPTIRNFPAFEDGFNPNEIAGALAWLAPLLVGIAAGPGHARGLRMAAGVAGGLLLAALVLGQSRAALVGTLGALAVLALLLLPARRRRLVAAVLAALAGAGVLFALHTMLTTGPLQPVSRETGSERDEISIGSRFDLAANSLLILRDYPFTGVGLSMYRDSRVRAAYPTPALNNRPPHTHNELLQVGVDMGISGLVAFVWLHLETAHMLYQSWRRGSPGARTVSAAVAAGLLAHVVYGLADAITLWDRLAFVFWLMLGLAGGQYVLVQRASEGEVVAQGALQVGPDLPELR